MKNTSLYMKIYIVHYTVYEILMKNWNNSTSYSAVQTNTVV